MFQPHFPFFKFSFIVDEPGLELISEALHAAAKDHLEAEVGQEPRAGRAENDMLGNGEVAPFAES